VTLETIEEFERWWEQHQAIIVSSSVLGEQNFLPTTLNVIGGRLVAAGFCRRGQAVRRKIAGPAKFGVN